jgi:sugar (pentulose or hexulose) kinase
MSKQDFLLGVDVGTSSVKAGVFDPVGNLLSTARLPYRLSTPRPGRVEQDPEAWWSLCKEAVKDVARRVDANRLAAMCVVALAPSLVCVDSRGEPVRPAPVWSDRRCESEADEIAERLGTRAFSPLLAQCLWLERNEADNYSRTRWVFQPYEYINFKLTGEVVSIALVPDRLPWSKRHLELVGIDTNRFPQRQCETGEVVAMLLHDQAVEMGLPSGLPVVAGTVDTFSTWLGTATMRKGELCASVGTTSSAALVWDERLEDASLRVSSIPHVADSGWVMTNPMSSGGLFLDWFARQFCGSDQQPFDAIFRAADSIPVGANGLIALPYLTGERAPIFDPRARGVFFGITPAHTKDHFARAILESTGFALRDLCDAIVEIGGEIREVHLAGAAARNQVWATIITDMLGKRTLIPKVADSGLVGAAMLAGLAVGRFETVESAAQSLVRFRTALEPNPESHAKYSQLMELYRNLYVHLKDDFNALGFMNL